MGKLASELQQLKNVLKNGGDDYDLENALKGIESNPIARSQLFMDPQLVITLDDRIMDIGSVGTEQMFRDIVISSERGEILGREYLGRIMSHHEKGEFEQSLVLMRNCGVNLDEMIPSLFHNIPLDEVFYRLRPIALSSPDFECREAASKLIDSITQMHNLIESRFEKDPDTMRSFEEEGVTDPAEIADTIASLKKVYPPGSIL